jgi:2-polyprenyl-6-methoxyphenol hydroxylase-like FAD-dependent oxidoreductase
MSPQVLVVGAGPTGLLLASELVRRDVDCLLIDVLEAPQGWDRATVVHARSLEIFEALRLVDRFLDRGVRTRHARFCSDGAELGVLDFELVGGRYPFQIGVSEEVTESVLAAHLEALGGAVRRSTRLVGLAQSVDAVVATLEHDGARKDVTASWVVGCDGSHSKVRELAGVAFQGSDLADPWAVFDAAIEGWEEDYDICAGFLDVPPVILTPLPGRRWRVYLRPRSETSDLVEEATPVLRPYMPQATFVDVADPGRFHCHSRVAERFRAGRVLLAGDAAHACSPAEGHGMNTGLQDAFNLGWKLALVCSGVSGAKLLDSYEVERRPVAQLVVDSGDAAEAGQAMTAADDRAARDAHIRARLNDRQSAHYEAAAHAELDRCYADSGAVLGDTNATFGPGDRLPDGLGVDGGDLHPLTHRAGHTLLVVGGADTPPGDVARLVEALEAAHADSGVVDAVVGLSPRAANANLRRIDNDAVDRLGVHDIAILAVRPDRYLGFRHDGADAAALEPYLEALAARQ